MGADTPSPVTTGAAVSSAGIASSVSQRTCSSATLAEERPQHSPEAWNGAAAKDASAKALATAAIIGFRAACRGVEYYCWAVTKDFKMVEDVQNVLTDLIFYGILKR